MRYSGEDPLQFTSLRRNKHLPNFYFSSSARPTFTSVVEWILISFIKRVAGRCCPRDAKCGDTCETKWCYICYIANFLPFHPGTVQPGVLGRAPAGLRPVPGVQPLGEQSLPAASAQPQSDRPAEGAGGLRPVEDRAQQQRGWRRRAEVRRILAAPTAGLLAQKKKRPASVRMPTRKYAGGMNGECVRRPAWGESGGGGRTQTGPRRNTKEPAAGVPRPTSGEQEQGADLEGVQIGLMRFPSTPSACQGPSGFLPAYLECI